MIAEFIKTFPYGGSVRTLFRLSRPLSDRTPLRSHVVRIHHPYTGKTNYLAAYTSGEVMCFSPICAEDMAAIEAAVAAAPSLVQ